MWRDPNDDGLGYSLSEKSRLQAANSNKKVHIKFDNDGSDNDELDSENDNEKKILSNNKEERNKKYSKLNFRASNLSTSKSFRSYNSRNEQKIHIALNNEDSDESMDSEMSDNKDQNSGSDCSEDQEIGNDSSDDKNGESDDQDGGSDVEGSTSADEVEDYSQMSMEELLRLQDKIGTKAFKEKVMKVKDSPNKGSKTGNTYKRLNKNRPSEMPLMRKTAPRMSYLDPHKKAKETILRDPRFDDLSGKLDLHKWDERFAFLKETRKKELALLKKQYSVVTNTKKKERIKLILQRMQNQQQESQKREQEQAIKRLERKQQKEALREGKKPKFMSNKTKKTMLEAMHFEKLKKTKKVDKYLERKEKRQLQKERKANW